VWMRFLAQVLLLRFLWFAGRALLPCQSLASLLHCALDSLVRFGLRGSRRGALLGGNVVLGHGHDNVAGALLISERTAHRRRAQPLPRSEERRVGKEGGSRGRASSAERRRA